MVMVVFLKFWRPKTTLEIDAAGARWSFGEHRSAASSSGWSPFILASVLIFLFAAPGLQPVPAAQVADLPDAVLHAAVIRMPPVVPAQRRRRPPGPERLALPGTAIFAGRLSRRALLGMRLAQPLTLLAQTFRQLVPSLLAISFMVGLAYVTRYSGMDTVLGLADAHGLDLPVLRDAARLAGRGADRYRRRLERALRQPAEGDRRAARPLARPDGLRQQRRRRDGQDDRRPEHRRLVAPPRRQEGREAAIFKAVFRHSIVLAILVGLLVMFYAYVTPWVIPGSGR